MKHTDVINVSQFDIVESQNVESNPLEKHSHETSQKVVNVDDTQPERKEETVSYVK